MSDGKNEGQFKEPQEALSFMKRLKKEGFDVFYIRGMEKAKVEDMNLDPRIYMQTEEWQRRFKALTKESPDSEWEWLVGYYDGDQDELDHVINEYKSEENKRE